MWYTDNEKQLKYPVHGKERKMPYIQIRTSNEITKEKIEEIKTSLGEIITIIPGKTEAALMVDIVDRCNLYYQGNQDEPNAYVKVEMFQKILPEYAVQVTGAITNLLEEKAGVPMNRTYVTHEGIPDWGRGNIHF